MIKDPIRIEERETENFQKEKDKQYNILVYIRLRPLLKSEFGKEVAIECREDVHMTWVLINSLGQKPINRHQVQYAGLNF